MALAAAAGMNGCSSPASSGDNCERGITKADHLFAQAFKLAADRKYGPYNHPADSKKYGPAEHATKVSDCRLRDREYSDCLLADKDDVTPYSECRMHDRPYSECLLAAKDDDAMIACMEYIKPSKTAEAGRLVREIATKTAAYYANNGRLPRTPTIDPDEAACCCVGGIEKIEPNPARWKRSPWSDIGFKIDVPTYYWVTLEVSSDAFLARAYGDLDCDGALSTFTMMGDIDDSGEMRVANLSRVNELE